MSYECELENGQHLEIDNEGDQTFVSFSNRGTGQRQSQGNGFTTGHWSKKPVVYRVAKDFIIQLETSDGIGFLRVHGNQMELLNREPALEKAETIELKKKSSKGGMRPMKPMEPMRPMKPMEPMKPMRPMEMKMGGMSMSMGGPAPTKSGKKFCTQCGNVLGAKDRFCANCGHEV